MGEEREGGDECREGRGRGEMSMEKGGERREREGRGR